MPAEGRGAALFAAVLVGAWAAQVVQPEATIHLPSPPWHWPAVAVPVLAALVLGWWRPDAPSARGLGGAPLAIASLLAVAATCWPLAVYPIGPAAPAWLADIGLADPLTALPFAAAIAAVALNLACSLGRRLRRGPDRVRYLVLHGGLLLAICGAAAGHAGLQRVRFVLEEGAPPTAVGIGLDGGPAAVPLPLALDDFVLERFPPMLLLAGTDGRLRRGEALMGPEAAEHLGGLHISVVDWMPSAAVPVDTPVAFRDPAANPAARVEVRDAGGTLLGSGWLHPSSPVGGALFLALSDGRTLHLEEPRPRRFLAQVRLRGATHEILVNAPLRADGWAIYLLSYDERLGPASSTAVFEAVEDRSLPAVYVGIALLLLGVLWHMWQPMAAGVKP